MSTFTNFSKAMLVVGLASTTASASNSLYFKTDTPESLNDTTDLTRKVSFVTDLSEGLTLSAQNQLKTVSGANMLGWDVRNGAVPDLSSSTASMRAVKLYPSTKVNSPTMTITTAFKLPAISAASNFESVWNVFDAEGNTHSVTTKFTKTAPLNWDVYFTSADATSISNASTPAHTVIDENKPLKMIFDANGLLTDTRFDGAAYAFPLNLAFAWNNQDVNQNIAINFGNVGGALDQDNATGIVGDTFVERSTTIDGSVTPAIAGGRVNKKGEIFTTYSDGSEEKHFQLAHVGFHMDGTVGFKANDLHEVDMDIINAALTIPAFANQ